MCARHTFTGHEQCGVAGTGRPMNSTLATIVADGIYIGGGVLVVILIILLVLLILRR